LFALATRSCILFVALTCLGSSSPAAEAQSPDPGGALSTHPTPQETKTLAFDVVSIRAAHGNGWLTRFTEDGFQGDSVPVQYFLRLAFSPTVASPDILGTPKWAGETYDIQAKVAPENVPDFKLLTHEQKAAMLQKILADRFQLRFHFGSTSHSIYNLTAVGADPKLMKFQVADYTG
jgi:uncharacterized protein (TIGR03435 family)